MEAKTYKCEGKQHEYSDDEYRDTKISLNFNNKDFFKKSCHDIRNSKQFSREILEKMNELSYENRLEILILYNEMIGYFLTLLDKK
jgi:hypothetical protein